MGERSRGCDDSGAGAPQRDTHAGGGIGLPGGAIVLGVAHASLITEQENAAVVRPLASLAEGLSSVSVTWVCLAGRHRALASGRSARVYYVLSGALTFVVSDSHPTLVRAEEAVVIPRGVVYGFEGSGTYLVINTPAFEPGDDEYAE